MNNEAVSLFHAVGPSAAIIGRKPTLTNLKFNQMQRYGSVIGLNADKLEEYKLLHAAVWPEVLRMITRCNLRNYSIYLRQFDDGQHFLFSYFEYVGEDFAADMAVMAADPTTQRWWALCMPCQRPLVSRAQDEWWASMEEVFHCE